MGRREQPRKLSDNEIMILWDIVEDDHEDASTEFIMAVVCDMAGALGVELDNGDIAAALGQIAARGEPTDA